MNGKRLEVTAEEVLEGHGVTESKASLESSEYMVSALLSSDVMFRGSIYVERAFSLLNPLCSAVH